MTHLYKRTCIGVRWHGLVLEPMHPYESKTNGGQYGICMTHLRYMLHLERHSRKGTETVGLVVANVDDLEKKIRESAI